jgi:hypothetical protein
LHIDEVALAPEANLRKDVCERIDPEIYSFPWDSAINLEEEVVKRDSSVRINGSIDSETEDIFGGLIGRADFKLSE